MHKYKSLQIGFLMVFFVSLIVSDTFAQNQEMEHPVTGVYEVCIGNTADLDDTAYSLEDYFALFGYTVSVTGEISAEKAEALYGVNSALQSVRLEHQNADHGLIRVMFWDEPRNDGIGMLPLLVPGSRWASALTDDILSIYNHCEYAESEGWDVSIVEPQWAVIYPMGEGRPYHDQLLGVREMIFMQPRTRQMFFQRYNYTIENYGAVNPDSKFKTSQVTHVGLVYESDTDEAVYFYSDVLGLMQTQEEIMYTYQEASESTRLVYGMEPGDYYFSSQFDDPRSSSDFEKAFSGRLLLRRLPSELDKVNVMEQSQPGSIGMSLYTLRVKDIYEYHDRVSESSATDVTDVMANEFGEASFTFTAPDGHTWNLVGGEYQGHDDDSTCFINATKKNAAASPF
jgi:uncharacterized glyoxalase superfamily protein PhnB